MSMSASTFDLLVAGGGAAGMMAAITAAENGASVCILEKNSRPCRKVYITGKGRCNVTNNCSAAECIENIPTNPKFLYSALHAFPPEKVMAFFEESGCPLKTERGNRVFPVSDRAADIIDALRERSRGLNIALKPTVCRRLRCENDAVLGMETDSGLFNAPAVILATGGASYPLTGSTGDGYAIAQAVGHTIVAPTGSLVPLECAGDYLSDLNGLSLRNVGVRLCRDGRCIHSEFGELTFTAFGLDGPTVLTCSAHMGRDSGFTLHLDLKPALTAEMLDARILREIAAAPGSTMPLLLSKLLPRQMIRPVLKQCGISPALAADALTKAARQTLIRTLKDLPFPILGKRPLEEAIVTSGGVSVSEVDPKTMQSRLISGLYFAGELLDVDAYTGGFNLQIAWATGHAAGLAAANSLRR